MEMLQGEISEQSPGWCLISCLGTDSTSHRYLKDLKVILQKVHVVGFES